MRNMKILTENTAFSGHLSLSAKIPVQHVICTNNVCRICHIYIYVLEIYIYTQLQSIYSHIHQSQPAQVWWSLHYLTSKILWPCSSMLLSSVSSHLNPSKTSILKLLKMFFDHTEYSTQKTLTTSYYLWKKKRLWSKALYKAAWIHAHTYFQKHVGH